MAFELDHEQLAVLHYAVEQGDIYYPSLTAFLPYREAGDYFYLSTMGMPTPEVCDNRLTAILLILAAEEELSDYL